MLLLLRRIVLAIVIGFHAFDMIVQPANGDVLDTTVITLGALVFALLHAASTYGWRDALVLLGVTAAVSYFGEWLSAGGGGAGTGITFGNYVYTDILGPKILGIPPLILAAYFAMGYASLTMARIIGGFADRRVQGLALVGFAAIASLIMCGWDLTMDPRMSTVTGAWTWTNGGGYFGIPLRNWLGWFVVLFTVFLVFLGYRAWRRAAEPPLDLPAGGRIGTAEPIMLYAAFGLNLLLAPFLGPLPTAMVGLQNPAFYTGGVGALMFSTSLIAVWAMGLPVVASLVKLFSAPRLTAPVAPAAARNAA